MYASRIVSWPFFKLVLCILITVSLLKWRNFLWEAWTFKVFLTMPVFVALQSGYHYFRIHEKYGFMRVQEPLSHYYHTLKTVWIIPLWAIGFLLMSAILGTENRIKEGAFLTWSLPKQFLLSTYFTTPSWLPSPSLDIHTRFKDNNITDILLGVLGFYMIDFLRYWVHRIGHWGVFYKTFPFAHFQHHTHVFINSFTTFVSPLLHPASWATYAPLVLLWSQDCRAAALVCFVITEFSNFTQHLGCDPFPWLTRINHYYCYGALPWIPLYHQYHHIPFVKPGNFGNTTALFDYLYGTLLKDSVEHIETGKMPQKLQEIFNDPNLAKKLDQALGPKNCLELGNDNGDEVDKKKKSWWSSLMGMEVL